MNEFLFGCYKFFIGTLFFFIIGSLAILTLISVNVLAVYLDGSQSVLAFCEFLIYEKEIWKMFIVILFGSAFATAWISP